MIIQIPCASCAEKAWACVYRETPVCLGCYLLGMHCNGAVAPEAGDEDLGIEAAPVKRAREAVILELKEKGWLDQATIDTWFSTKCASDWRTVFIPRY